MPRASARFFSHFLPEVPDLGPLADKDRVHVGNSPLVPDQPTDVPQ